MPRANTVEFRYDPMDSTLYIDQSRIDFFMERLDSVRDELFELCDDRDIHRQLKGEIVFTNDPNTPPRVGDLGYASHWADEEKNQPLPDTLHVC